MEPITVTCLCHQFLPAVRQVSGEFIFHQDSASPYTAFTADLQVVFAYPFHFGKSGFSAYFSRQIRISGFYPDFFVQVRMHRR